MSENRYRLNIDQVRNFLPHRQPFLLIDRVLEIHPKADVTDSNFGSQHIGTRVVALKNVSYNEPCFAGHFPEMSILPGVLIVEAMAQATSFSLYPYLEHDLTKMKNLQTILAGVDNARFRRPVVPGDSMRIETEVTKCRGRIWAFHCVATVDGQKVAEADLLANIIYKGEVASA